MKAPRYYQSDAADALMDSIHKNINNHPIAAIPTGAGKTMVMCDFIDKYLSKHPTSNILVLSHVKEILEQNYNSITEAFDGLPIGLYSSGLGSKSIKKITVAGIQSVHRRPNDFYGFDIVIIDECHLVNARNKGMYRKFLSGMDANYVGLTATHFRSGHGYIHKGENRLFNQLVYNKCNVEGFAELIGKGFLCKLIAKGTDMKLDTAGLKTRMNDYVPKEMSQRFDRKNITEKAVDEIIEYGSNYKKWLVFAIDIEHAENVTKMLVERGISAACVHSKMEIDRSEYIDGFKKGKYKCVVNVDILTTGFDAPDIDLIAVLRPTQSPILHIQLLGRGMRVSPNKDHCLVLDFAGNVKRLGPINDVQITQIKEKKNKGAAKMKECPKCNGYLHLAAKTCDYCGYVYPVKEKIETTAYTGDIIRFEQPPGSEKDKELAKTPVEIKKVWVDVLNIKYIRHERPNKPLMMKVHYLAGYQTIVEYVNLDHTGYPRHKAKNWVQFRYTGMGSPPDCVEDLLKAAKEGKLKSPKRLEVVRGGRYSSIENVEF